MPACTSCGTSVGYAAKYCPECGAAITTSEPGSKTQATGGTPESTLSGWYNNSFFLWAALILFFPIGLYGVLKNETWSGKQQFVVFMGVFCIAFIGLIGAAMNAPEEESQTETEPQLTAGEQAERDSIARVEAAAQARMDSIEARTRKIESQFSGWDGAHRAVEDAIVERLKDPDSYEHIETRYRDDGTTLFVVTRYRAKNSFGGYVVNRATATVDLEGNILALDMGE